MIMERESVCVRHCQAKKLKRETKYTAKHNIFDIVAIMTLKTHPMCLLYTTAIPLICISSTNYVNNVDAYDLKNVIIIIACMRD